MLALDLQELVVWGGSQMQWVNPRWHIDRLSPTLSLGSCPPSFQEDPFLAVPFTGQSKCLLSFSTVEGTLSCF